jgi:hypothetical protein
MNDNSNRARRERGDVPVGTGPSTANVGVLEHQIDQERIARRAYEIYESRHRADGHADEDWFQAASEYAARRESGPTAFEHYGASRSFGDRIRSARR